jgi:hypothetical protein
MVEELKLIFSFVCQLTFLWIFFLLQALSKALTEDELFYLRAQFNLLGPNGDGSVSLDNFRMVSHRFYFNQSL